jgi:hypothetical protein
MPDSHQPTLTFAGSRRSRGAPKRQRGGGPVL